MQPVGQVGPETLLPLVLGAREVEGPGHVRDQQADQPEGGDPRGNQRHGVDDQKLRLREADPRGPQQHVETEDENEQEEESADGEGGQAHPGSLHDQVAVRSHHGDCRGDHQTKDDGALRHGLFRSSGVGCARADEGRGHDGQGAGDQVAGISGQLCSGR